MLGPLPVRYRRMLAVGVVLGFLVAGLVLGAASIVPVMPGTAVALAAPAGVLVAFLLIHDFTHAPQRR